jgi:hypothetical protein
MVVNVKGLVRSKTHDEVLRLVSSFHASSHMLVRVRRAMSDHAINLSHGFWRLMREELCRRAAHERRSA